MCSHERVTWRVSRVLPEARRQLPKLLCGILSAVVTAAKRPASLNYHFRLHQAGENVERERERERERETAGFSAPGKPNRLRAGTLRIDINATALLVD